MGIKARALCRQAKIRKQSFESVPQPRRTLPLHAAADPDREVITSRKHPEISMQAFEKLHLKRLPGPGHVIAHGDHEIVSAQGRSKLATKWAARACRQQ